METNQSLNIFCHKIGQDPFLVQGAGGNVSIKDDNILLVKASGTSLSEAMKKNIFVSVDLDTMYKEFNKGNFSFTPASIDGSSLKPSIETMLHAIMKHKVVVHLHMVSALTHLVKDEAEEDLCKIFDHDYNWSYVPYTKPGENLAKSISDILNKKPTTDIIFLGNHGIVIGSDSIVNAEKLLYELDIKLGRESFDNKKICSKANSLQDLKIKGFEWCHDNKLHNLVTNTDLFYYTKNYWALFPDHVVFLGEKPFVVDDLNQLFDTDDEMLSNHCFIFINRVGILQNINATNAQKEQLTCYFDVISNIDPNLKLKTLSNKEVGELLNWDAEVYRQQLSK